MWTSYMHEVCGSICLFVLLFRANNELTFIAKDNCLTHCRYREKYCHGQFFNHTHLPSAHTIMYRTWVKCEGCSFLSEFEMHLFGQLYVLSMLHLVFYKHAGAVFLSDGLPAQHFGGCAHLVLMVLSIPINQDLNLYALMRRTRGEEPTMDGCDVVS
jgi:hypothetical protein